MSLAAASCTGCLVHTSTTVALLPARLPACLNYRVRAAIRARAVCSPALLLSNCISLATCYSLLCALAASSFLDCPHFRLDLGNAVSLDAAFGLAPCASGATGRLSNLLQSYDWACEHIRVVRVLKRILVLQVCKAEAFQLLQRKSHVHQLGLIEEKSRRTASESVIIEL